MDYVSEEETLTCSCNFSNDEYLRSSSYITESESENNVSNKKFPLYPIDTEFLYYSALLKELAPKLTEENDRQKLIAWIKKIFRPEYHSSLLKIKRNKYLLFMTMSVLNNEAYHILQTIPPFGAVPDIECLKLRNVGSCEWEVDDTWDKILQEVPKEQRQLVCIAHKNGKDCTNDHKWDDILDEEFKFMLYLARPYYFMSKEEDRPKIQAWFELLCSIRGSNCCSTMKGIRNDYVMILLGYLQELQLLGPFMNYPPKNTLLPLSQMCRLSSGEHCLDPTSKEVDEFLSKQPRPSDGAMCYLAVTGQLVSSNKNFDTVT